MDVLAKREIPVPTYNLTPVDPPLALQFIVCGLSMPRRVFLRFLFLSSSEQ
jgi:hypothetical protein